MEVICATLNCQRITFNGDLCHYHYYREYNQIAQKKRGLILKQLIIEKFGNRCNCCGENTYELLTLDHINEDAASKEKGKHTYQKWASALKNPLDDYQILCHNCNWGKSKYGVCPHQKK